MRLIICVLAGGASKRFEGSKLSIRVNDQPVLTWLRSRLKEVADTYWLSLGPDQTPPEGSDVYDHVIRDKMSHQGPLHAINQIVHAAEKDDMIAIIPADMFMVTPEFITVLFNCLSLSLDQAAVMAKWAVGENEGRIEPLPSAWRAGPAQAVVSKAISQGLAGPKAMANWPGIGKTFLYWEESETLFANINKRDDLAKMRQATNLKLTVANEK